MSKGILYALIASILWGIDYAIAEKVFNKYSVYTVLFFELFVGAIIMLLIGYGDIKQDLVQFKSFSSVSLFAVCCLVFNAGLLFICKSIKDSNATVAGLIEISYPFFIMLSSYILFGENHITKSVLVGAAFIFSGIAIIYFDPELNIMRDIVMVFIFLPIYLVVGLMMLGILIFERDKPYVRTRSTYQQWLRMKSQVMD